MELIRYEQKGNLAYVTLNRPEAMNAFNYDMLGRIRSNHRSDPYKSGYSRRHLYGIWGPCF